MNSKIFRISLLAVFLSAMPSQVLSSVAHVVEVVLVKLRSKAEPHGLAISNAVIIDQITCVLSTFQGKTEQIHSLGGMENLAENAKALTVGNKFGNLFTLQLKTMSPSQTSPPSQEGLTELVRPG